MNPYHKIKDFHAARRKGIGASDVPTLAGLNKRHGATPLTLYKEKRGEAEPFDGNERTDWGKRLEAMVLQKFIEGRYGVEAGADFLASAIRGRSSGPFKVKTEFVHPQRRYCLSHPDLLVEYNPEAWSGYVSPAPYLVEAKTSGLYSAKRREGVQFEGYDPDDRSQFGIPDKVFMQVQWQLYTAGLTEAWVACLIDTADYREYGPIIFDPRHVEQSLALAEKFWLGHVEPGIEPAPSTWGDVVSMYPSLEDKTAMVSGEEEMSARRMVSEGAEIKAKIKALNERLDDIKMGLGILAGDTRGEDGKIVRTMNKVLNDSSGQVIATFNEQTRDSISLPLAEVLKKRAKRDSIMKKLADGKKVSEAEIEAAKMTPEDLRVMAVDAELRALGAYKTSEPFRVVNY